MSLNESGQQVYNLEVLELHCCEKNFKSDTTERTVRHAAVTRARNKIEFLISTKDVKKTVCLTPSTSSSRLTLFMVCFHAFSYLNYSRIGCFLPN